MQKTESISYMKGFLPYALAAFLVGLVGGLSTVLAPAFVQDLNLSYNNTTWTALAQAISTAACAPILGKLGDIFGRRKTLFGGLVIFLIGNVLSALAPSLFFMLMARFIIGVGTAAIAPTVMSYIVTSFPPEQIGKGFSLYMLISSSGVIFGPSIGSIILQATNWRILMWISSAVCGIFLILCFITHPRNAYTPKKLIDFDTWGAIFVIVFFSLLLCIPSLGQNFGWSSTGFIVVLVFSLLALIGLVIVEKHAKNPILSGSFMARKAFILPVAILFLTQGLMQANMTNTIVFVNYTQPENSVISGYAISIMYLGMSLGSILLGPLADRFEPKRILSLSLVLTGIGCGFMLLYSENTTIFILAASLGILGFGLGANAAIFMKVVLSKIPVQSAGTGTGIYGLFRDLAAPFGVAVFVPMFTNRITNLTSVASNALSSGEAAVRSIHSLAVIELACVGLGIVIVQFLPKIHHPEKGESNYAAEK